MTIGERLRQIRKHLNQTQEKVAERLGIGPETLSRYENDRRTPDIDFLTAFGSHFNVSGNWLLYEASPVFRTPFKEQGTKGMFLEMAAAINAQDGLEPSPAHVTDISKDTLVSTPENFVPMIEYMLKDPEVCRDMLQFFYLFQKPAADKRLAASGSGQAGDG
jgi:transcriptional regulator with XRE-family HTH domain